MPAFAALLALALAAPPRPPSALDRCAAIPTELGFQYECADLVARMDDSPEKGDAAAKTVAGRLRGVEALVGPGAETRTEKRLLGAGEVEVHVTEAPGKPAVFLAPLSFEAGTRILSCHGPTKRCAAVLSGLAALPWRSGVPARGAVRKETGPLAIGGRAVPVPKGCEGVVEPRGGRIVCGKTAWVLWVAGDEGPARQLLASNLEQMRNILVRPGWTRSERELPCRLAGTETTCTELRSESGQGVLLVLMAAAPVGGAYAYASCMMQGKTAGSPCTLVLEPR